MGSFYKKTQSMLEFLNTLVLNVKLLLMYLDDLPDNNICNIAIYAIINDTTTVYCKCYQANHLC